MDTLVHLLTTHSTSLHTALLTRTCTHVSTCNTIQQQVKDGPSPGSWNANPIDPAVNKASHLRLRTLLGIEGANDPEVLAGIGKYGVGSVRSMEQYQVS
jgi:hypothetical protein